MLLFLKATRFYIYLLQTIALVLPCASFKWEQRKEVKAGSETPLLLWYNINWVHGSMICKFSSLYNFFLALSFIFKFIFHCFFKHPFSIGTLTFDFILYRFDYIVVEYRETAKNCRLQSLNVFNHLLYHLFLAEWSTFVLS
jgi:hypothetical protein